MGGRAGGWVGGSGVGRGGCDLIKNGFLTLPKHQTGKMPTLSNFQVHVLTLLFCFPTSLLRTPLIVRPHSKYDIPHMLFGQAFVVK